MVSLGGIQDSLVNGDEISVLMEGKLFFRQAGKLFFLGREECKRKPNKDMSDNGGDKYQTFFASIFNWWC